MKKALTLLLVFALVFSFCGLVACSDKDGDGDTTSGSTNESGNATDGAGNGDTTTAPETKDEETTPEETEEGPGPNSFPYEVEDESMMPLSITNMDYEGAPTADAQYFVIAPENVIHEGKGTYNNATNTIGTAAFDRDATTYYDCDENCNYVNTEGDSSYGIVLEDWNCEDQASAIEAGKSGFVGAYFEDGIKLIQIRYMPRTGASMVARLTGAVFQASVDGKEWVDLYTVEEGDVLDGFFSDFNVPEEYADTVFHYVRMLGRPHDHELVDPEDTGTWSYCNIAEIEIWGTPAA